jgi:hypothetical protein
MTDHPPILPPYLSAAQLRIAAQSTSCRVFNTLGSFCNLGSCPGTLDFGCRRQWGEENNNATTSQNGRKRRSAARGGPRSRLQMRGARVTVRHSGGKPASMRKFGEYIFLEDSRYARQAKSACALPLGDARASRAWTHSGVLRMGLASPLSRLGRNDERKGWLYSAASSGARFSAC